MARRGEPISAIDALLVVVLLAAGSAADYALVGRSSMVSIAVAVATGSAVVMPVSTLIHELGHAAAVRALGKRRSLVVVGRGPWIKLDVGGVTVRFSFLPSRGILMGGICRYSASGMSWRSIAWIALAGPIATFAEVLALVGTAPLVWNAGPFIRQLIFTSTASLVYTLAVNVTDRPLKPGSEAAVVGQRDGWVARQAFARSRAGAAPFQPASGANPGVTPSGATGVLNAAASVPPPAPR